MRFVRPVSTGNRPLTLLTISITVESIWKILSMTVWLLCVLLQGWYWYRWISCIHTECMYIFSIRFTTAVCEECHTNFVSNEHLFDSKLLCDDPFIQLFLCFSTNHLDIFIFLCIISQFIEYFLTDPNVLFENRVICFLSNRPVYQFLLYSSHSQPCSQKKTPKHVWCVYGTLYTYLKSVSFALNYNSC